MITEQQAYRIVEHLEQVKDDMYALLHEMVIIETPSRDATAQQPMFDLLRREFAKRDYITMRFAGKETGGSIYARPRDRTRCRPIQLMIGHCDTVWPLGTIQKMPWQRAKDRTLGPGVFDMKAGLVQMFFALDVIRMLDLECDTNPIVFINADEEIGSRETTEQIKRLAKIAARAYILEPPLGESGQLKTARKGIARYMITVTGEPAHAGLDPGKGASAIVELSHQIQSLFALNDFERGISVNVGMIEGGIAANVVAPTSKAIIDVRVLTREDAERIDEQIRSLKPVNPSTSISIEGSIGRPPMESNLRNEQLWEAAQQEGSKIGLNLEAATAGGGSDGNTTSLYCATLDGLGTTGDGAHAEHEFIYTHKLVERTALLTLLLCLPPTEHHKKSDEA